MIRPKELSMTHALRAAGIAGTTLAAGLGLLAGQSAASPSLPTLDIAMTPTSIAVSGATVSGAVDVAATVSGEATDSPALFRLNTGVTAAEVGAAVSAFGPNTPLDALDPYGQIVYDGTATRGQTTHAQVYLQPGNYAAFENGNGVATFTVTASAHPRSLPAPAATITAIDFAFHGAATIHDGQLVRFQNDGWLIHMFAFAGVKSLADARKAEALLRAGEVGHGQAKKYGTGVKGQFAGPLSHGAVQQEVVNEPPGYYVIYCGMNAEDGREHFQLGMFRTLRIVK